MCGTTSFPAQASASLGLRPAPRAQQRLQLMKEKGTALTSGGTSPGVATRRAGEWETLHQSPDGQQNSHQAADVPHQPLGRWR